MDLLDRKKYDDFYVAYFDTSGRMIYPSDPDEVKTIQSMIKKTLGNNIIFLEDRNLYYKLRIKRAIVDGIKVQVIELSNITEYLNQVSQASIDEITHLNNRKIARSLFSQYIEQAYKMNEDFAVIFADLDGFKSINDTYGHMNGDIVLSEISRILFCSTRQESWREKDIVARIGGDEFTIVMKNVSKEVALNRAEIIRSYVESHQISLFSESDEEKYIKVGTISMGLYHVTHQELEEFYKKGYTTEELRKIIIDRCDGALYASKNNGKNKISLFSKGRSLQLDK